MSTDQEKQWLDYWQQAQTNLQAGKLEQAEAFLHSTLELAEKFKPDDNRISISLECLSEVLFKLNKLTDVEPVMKRLVATTEQFKGEAGELGVHLNNLALIHHRQKKLFMAESEYQKALAILNKVFGPDHPQTQNATANFAKLLRETHRHQAAQKLEETAGSGNGDWSRSGSWQAFSPSRDNNLAANQRNSVRTQRITRSGERGRYRAGSYGRGYDGSDEEVTLQDFLVPDSLTGDRHEPIKDNPKPPSPATQNGPAGIQQPPDDGQGAVYRRLMRTRRLYHEAPPL